MAIYEIQYVETNTCYFGVEADSEEEALERFEEWKYCDNHIDNTMRSSWNHDSEWSVNDWYKDNSDEYFDEEDILTEEMYQAL